MSIHPNPIQSDGKPASHANNVFTYWTGQKPLLIRKLLALMEFHSENGEHYRFHLLDDKTIGELIPLHPAFHTLSAVHQADYARVALVCKYGGIWLDADTIVMNDLAEVFEALVKSSGFLVHNIHDRGFVNAAFGSLPETALMCEWRDRIECRLSTGEQLQWTDLGASILADLDPSGYTVLNGIETVYPVPGHHNESLVARYLENPHDTYRSLLRDFQPFLILTHLVCDQYKSRPDAPIEYFLERSLAACRGGIEPGTMAFPCDTVRNDRPLAPEVTIYTVHDKAPEFLRMQHATLEKHCRDRYQLVVLDNAVEFTDSMQIWRTCQHQGIPYLRVPAQRHENANVAASYPLDYLTRTRIGAEKNVKFSVILDSDMFLMRPVSFAQFARDYEIAAVFQSRGRYGFDHPENHVKYLWNGLVVFNHSLCDDFSKIIWACGACNSSPYFPMALYDGDYQMEGESVDVGGPTYYWLKDGHSIRYIDWTKVTETSCNLDLLPVKIRASYLPFYRNGQYSSDLLMEGAIFHYRAGSNWNGMREALIGLKKLILGWMITHSLGKVTPYDAVVRHQPRGAKSRILVGICSCLRHRSRRQAVRETWFPQHHPNMTAVFFAGGGSQGEHVEPDLLCLAVEDGYDHLPAKVQAFFQYALEHFDFDWLYKCDDDTYVVPQRLMRLAAGDHDLAGNEWLADACYASGGAGYLISREWVAALASDPNLPRIGAEDVIITGTAVVNGARVFSTEDLCWHGGRIATSSNTLVSTHGLDPDQMRTAHCVFTEEAEGVVDIIFDDRPTRVHLLESGGFSVDQGNSYGAWDIDDESNMVLEFIPNRGKAIVPVGSLFSEPAQVPLKIGILVIATGRYRRFIQQLVVSVQRHFLPTHHRTVFLLTDAPLYPQEGVVVIPVESKPWPGMALLRYSLFQEHEERFGEMDYLYYLDADTLVSGHVGNEVIGDLVATLHPGFVGGSRASFTYENNPESNAYVASTDGKSYYCGAFQGGLRDAYLGAVAQMAASIQDDLRKGIIAKWHDESHWNRYLIDRPPTKVLSPSYCYPDGQKLWHPQKITALDKNHGLFRNPDMAGPTEIVFRLCGGIGNQLFGYATGLALARFFGCGIGFSHSMIERSFELGVFGVSASDLWNPTDACFSDFSTWDPGSLERLRSFVNNAGAERTFIEGYFQNEQFFAEVADELRRSIRIEGVLSVNPMGRTPVCIQIRRGDYLNNSEYDILSECYFSDAIRIIRSFVNDPLFYIVSDDLDWCRHRYGDLCDFVVPDIQNTIDGLRTMVACSAFVISNSTYGWWGAWLANAPLVIAPDPWLGTQHWNCVPSRWIRLPSKGLAVSTADREPNFECTRTPNDRIGIVQPG